LRADSPTAAAAAARAGDAAVAAARAAAAAAARAQLEDDVRVYGGGVVTPAVAASRFPAVPAADAGASRPWRLPDDRRHHVRAQLQTWRDDVDARASDGLRDVPGILQRLQVRDFLSLAHELNDDVISAFFNVVVATANRDRPAAQPRVTAFNTYFYHDLTCDRRDGFYRYDRVSRRSDGLHGSHLDGDIVFPIHRPGHWIFAVVACRERHIYVIDSVGHANSAYAHADVNANLRRWLRDEWAKHRPHDAFDAADWTTSFSGSAHPAQHDGFTCGLFTCMQAYYWARHRRLALATDFDTAAGSADFEDIRCFVCETVMAGDPGAAQLQAAVGEGGWLDEEGGHVDDDAAHAARALIEGRVWERGDCIDAETVPDDSDDAEVELLLVGSGECGGVREWV
jgi:hypothetical protein